MLLENIPVIVASHPRSGTHLLIDFILRQFPDVVPNKNRFSFKDTSYINLDEFLSLKAPVTAAERNKFQNNTLPIVKTHRLSDFFEPYQYLNAIAETRLAWARALQDQSKVIYIYRDVKNVMLSLYYFMPKAQRINLDIHQFIREKRGKRNFSRIGFWCYHVNNWLNNSNVLVLEFNQLKTNTTDSLHSIENFIGHKAAYDEPLLPTAPSSLASRRLKTFLTKKPESTAILSHEKRIFDLESFTKMDEAFIRAEIESLTPELLQRISWSQIGVNV